jgi:hypothetical protein
MAVRLKVPHLAGFDDGLLALEVDIFLSSLRVDSNCRCAQRELCPCRLARKARRLVNEACGEHTKG